MRKVVTQPLHSHHLCSDPPPIRSKPCWHLGTCCVPLGRIAENKPTAWKGRKQGTISQNQAPVRTPTRTASTSKIPLNPRQSQSSCPRPVEGNSLPAESLGKPKNVGVGSLSLLQRSFLTQESNRGLLHCKWILYQLSYPNWGWITIHSAMSVFVKCGEHPPHRAAIKYQLS